MFKAGKFKEAMACYTMAIDLSIDPVEKSLSYANRAAAHLGVDDVESALQDSSEALKINPKFVKALDRRSRIFQKLREWNDALDDAVAAALLDEFQSNKYISQIEEILKIISETEARTMIVSRKHPLNCNWTIKQFFRTFPTEMRDLKLLSQDNEHFKVLLELMHGERFEELYELLRENEKQGDRDFICLNWLGSFRFLAGELDAAECSLKSALSARPESAEARVKLALVCLEKGRYSDMMALMDQALEFDRENASIYYHRGEIFALSDNLEAAVSDFSCAIKLDPGFLDAYIHLARAYITMQMLAQAKEYIAAGLKVFPDNPELLHTLGECQALEGDFGEALKNFDTVERLDPNFPHVQLSSALVRSRITGSTEDELENDLLDILKKFPHFAAAHVQLAGFYVDHCRIDAANRHYEYAAQNSRSFQEIVSICSMKAISIAHSNVSRRYPDLKDKLNLSK